MWITSYETHKRLSKNYSCLCNKMTYLYIFMSKNMYTNLCCSPTQGPCCSTECSFVAASSQICRSSTECKKEQKCRYPLNVSIHARMILRKFVLKIKQHSKEPTITCNKVMHLKDFLEWRLRDIILKKST